MRLLKRHLWAPAELAFRIIMLSDIISAIISAIISGEICRRTGVVAVEALS